MCIQNSDDITIEEVKDDTLFQDNGLDVVDDITLINIDKEDRYVNMINVIKYYRTAVITILHAIK